MLEGKPVIIHGDGLSLWTMTHNSDFARAFVRLMGNIHAIGEAVHITTDESVTWNQLYQIIADALDVKLNAVHVTTDFLIECSQGLYDFRGGLLGDKSNTVVFDNTKLKRLAPGFCASVRLDEGIRMTIAHILAHPELQQEDLEFDKWCDRVIKAMDAAHGDFNRN
jgi:nucleoside-diphosphate-sugar epimerase